MGTYGYRIIAGGLIADDPCRRINGHDTGNTIGEEAKEARPACTRPPLMKALCDERQPLDPSTLSNRVG